MRTLGVVPSYYLRYFYAHDEVVAEQRSSGSRAARVAEIEEQLLAMYADPALDEKPALVKAFLEGHLAALDYIAANPEEAQTVSNDRIESLTDKRLDDAVIAAAFANLSFTADPIAASLDGSKEHAVEVGLLEDVDLKGIYKLDPLNEVLSARGDAKVSAGDLA